MDTFPLGNERKDLISHNRRETANFALHGKHRIRNKKHYSWTDSPVDGTYSSELNESPISWSFREILPLKYQEKLSQYIEDILKSKKGSAVGIEFGGVRSNLFSGFSQDFFQASVGVTLVNHLDPEEGDPGDFARHHQILEGDIFSENTYTALDRLLRGKKPDLIIERMAAGLEFTPIEPYTVSKILAIWYKLLNQEGIMFVQTPIQFNHLLKAWTEKIKSDFRDTIEFESHLGSNQALYPSTFRLRKLMGAPSELPLLEPKVVRKTPKS